VRTVLGTESQEAPHTGRGINAGRSVDGGVDRRSERSRATLLPASRGVAVAMIFYFASTFSASHSVLIEWRSRCLAVHTLRLGPRRALTLGVVTGATEAK
jgi:hypothetical protein